MKPIVLLLLGLSCLCASPAFAQEPAEAADTDPPADSEAPESLDTTGEAAEASDPPEPPLVAPPTQPVEPEPSKNPLVPESELPHHQRHPVEAVPEAFKPARKADDDPLTGVGGDGQLVVRIPEPKPPVLFINPEISLGGIFNNYRSLGYFSYVAFGGGIGFTLKEQWHFRANVWAMGEPHLHQKVVGGTEEEPEYAKQNRTLWFIQPAAYVMYNLARYPDYHYVVPMDLYFGAKIGANVFRTDRDFYNVKNEVNFLYGLALYPRFYVFKRALGIAPSVELATVDYLRNFFVTYGVTLFWDFEVIGVPED